jgi:multiple sugar transport system ATP-binding protein
MTGGNIMAKVEFVDIGKIYPGPVEAVKHLDLTINDGEFMCLLGPSGCGKSTTMRMIAGLEEITSGKMYIDDVCVNTMSSRDRDVAMAFENYALYPNMSVGENIAFPLEIRKVSKDVIEQKVLEAARLLGIEELLDESIKGLSGGVQQRVGVARALVRNPKVLILDEPISHLEEELKAKMREELRKLQRKLNVTTLYVTHDQIEAMVMADRIAVMNQGVLQQVDTPQIIYHNPANVFVGGFIGEPPMNFISCSLSREQNETCFVFDEVRIPCPKKLFARIESVTDTNSVIIGARDTHIELSEKPKEGFVQGKVFFIEPRSEELLVTIEIGKQRILATTGMKTAVAIDAPVWVALDYERCSYFHTETEQNLFG